MKFKFDSNLDYQTDAISAVTDLFKGQAPLNSYFSFNGQTSFDYYYFDNSNNTYQKDGSFGQGIGNKLTISDLEILENLRKVQESNGLPLSITLSEGKHFDIEMETGTGKTYVYLKTIFELNKLYGFTKFIIVVPSIAIKEGVYKTIKITKEHFKGLYDNVIYDYFVYDSSKLEQVRNFATNSNIEIMIINIQAFNKNFEEMDENKSNIIHREQDKLNGYKPIDLIKETNPIVIIDEPQSVLSGEGETAISSLEPLCTLRYSATPSKIHNLVYKLDAVDAYNEHLVKGIEVIGIEPYKYFNKPYFKLLSIFKDNDIFKAKIELDINENGIIKRKKRTLKEGANLFEVTNLEIYDGYIIDSISYEKWEKYVSFTQKSEKLKLNVPIGGIDDLEIKRVQIRETIKEHLNKELNLNKKGIKVLSLFFIDKVENYRTYDEEGNPQKGKYALIFEEEYEQLIKEPEYLSLCNNDFNLTAEEVHNGYFSADNKGNFKNTRGESTADESTYNLIMKDKEKLLSFDSKLKFIFSHSALREGWDNPNVFQICTLNETNSSIKKRQEIGRGLRLCVNQRGERIFNESINILTVIANENYKSFAENLQKEIEKETKIKFNIIKEDSFSDIKIKTDIVRSIGSEGSSKIYEKFKEMFYINENGKIQNALKVAIKENNVIVPEEFNIVKDHIIEKVSKLIWKNNIKDRENRKEVKVNDKVFNMPKFSELWNKIKYKTTYLVNFDSEKLIEECSKVLSEELEVHLPKILILKSGLTIDVSGVNVLEEDEISPSFASINKEDIVLPDIITFLQRETSLTRKTIVQILVKSKTIELFKKNPYEYMENALKIIKRELNYALIDGIEYIELNDFFSKKLFKENEIFIYGNDEELYPLSKSVYNYIIWDSKLELQFAKELERDPQVEIFLKLPKWFKINTPIGSYNPDWAILFDNNSEKIMCFVVETKGDVDLANLKKSLTPSEYAKFKCGKKHFETLNKDVLLKLADKYSNFKADIYDELG